MRLPTHNPVWLTLIALALGLVLQVSSPKPASAYSTGTCNLTSCWPSGGYQKVRWLTSPVFSIDSMGTESTCSEFSTSSWRNEVNCMVKAWSDVGSATIAPTTRTDTNGWHLNDSSNDNDIAFAPGSSFDPGVLASAWIQPICDCYYTTRIDEADILFNEDISWNVGPVAPNSTNYNFIYGNAFRVVALHEIGHALGLSDSEYGGSHENSELATMSGAYPNAGWYRGDHSYHGRFWPHPDDAQGLHWMNPSSSAGRDLAVSRSKYGSGGQATDLSPITPNSICPGQTISINYTIENRGNETLSSVGVKFYLSTDAWIDPSVDISTASTPLFTLGPYTSATYTSSTTVPSSVTPGDYYVGVYIDPTDAFTGEASATWNNGVNLPVSPVGNELLEVRSCP